MSNNVVLLNDDNFEDFLSNNYSDDLDLIISEEGGNIGDHITYLDDQWDGDKPEDNLVLGSDFSFKSETKK